jgi:hypothetical protein
MRRLVLLAAAVLSAPLAMAWADQAAAAEAPAPHFLTWPGKSGGGQTAASRAAPSGPAPVVSLSKQFFASGSEDLAAAPPPLMPRPVPGTPAITNTASANTASNRARQNELLTADSASDGPVAGAQSPN